MKVQQLLILLLITVSTLNAQKQPLNHSVYDSWKSITNNQISKDGEWLIYSLTPQEGDRILRIYNTENENFTTFKRAEKAQISHGSEVVTFKIVAALDTVRMMQRKKVKKDKMPKDSLGIYNLESQKLVKIPFLKSYKLPKKNGQFLAYQVEVDKNQKKAKKNEGETEEPKQKKSKKRIKKQSKENGYHLIVRNLSNNKEDTIKYVTAYNFTENGDFLAVITTGSDTTFKGNTVDVYNTKTGILKSTFINNGIGTIENLTWDESGEKLAFVADIDTSKHHKSDLIKYHDLYFWNNKKGNITRLVNTNNLEDKWQISNDASLRFSKDGTKLFFGTKPIPKYLPDTLQLKSEKVVLDIWSWNDGYLQPQQLVNLKDDKKKSYQAVYDFKSNKYIQLGSEKIPNIQTNNNANAEYAVGTSTFAYQKLISWEGFPETKDIFLINTKTGKSEQIAKKIKGNIRVSPGGNYLTWYEKKDSIWFVYDINNRKKYNISKSIGPILFNEENDVPDNPWDYGTAGWTEKDKAFLVYDAYDIWSVEIENNQLITNRLTTGREKNIRYRNVRLNYDVRYTDTKNMMLYGFNRTTKSSGFYRLDYKNKKTKILIEAAAEVDFIGKAKAADKLVFTKETFEIFPDLYLTNMDFEKPKKVSNANPQQANYNWGTVELMNYTNLDGKELQGLIYKPENFDPNKKYPMLVYFYEKYTDRLHRYYTPRPLRSAVNFTYLTSNEYIVFVPDIIYKDGYPGQSAYNCIMPAVQEMMNEPYINTEKMGIQGHSWGGYQTAYLVTRTNLFVAAESGAPVSNMTSAYGGIRWRSGLSRMFQYEHTQSRIGGTLWEKPMQYLENSPVFHADKIETPLLILHNDGDGAVPWYQGIELFVAMRRLEKEAWLLNYNGDGHGVTKRQNQKDFAIRMYQFFDHYLKDKPAPSWMLNGIPAVEKGLNRGY